MTVCRGNMVVRQTNTITSGELLSTFLHPENIMLQFERKVRTGALDVGSLAFAVRGKAPRGKSNGKHQLPVVSVDTNTLIPERRVFLSKCFEHHGLAASSDGTINWFFTSVRQVLDWCDENGKSSLFSSTREARGAYKAYVGHLKESLKLNIGKRTPRTANGLQRLMMVMFEIYFDDIDCSVIFQGVSVIKFNRTTVDSPEEQDVRFLTRVALCLSKQFTEHLLGNSSFPLKLEMPGYTSYYFPKTGRECKTPYTHPNAEYYAFDYVTGKVRTVEECLTLYKSKYKYNHCASSVEQAIKSLEDANNNPRGEARYRVATIAAQAYLQLFMLVTGINTSELIELEYDKAYKQEKDLFKNDFRGIKFRANGRETAYFLGEKYGYRIFKEYLKLRDWLLDGLDCKWLFFNITREGVYTGKPQQLALEDPRRFVRRIRGKFAPATIKNIATQKARKFKDSIMYELRTNPLTNAKVMNHSPATNRSDYAATTLNKQQEEFSNYWAAARAALKLIKVKSEVDIKDEAVPSGHCDDHGNPNASEPTPPIEPNCNTQFGCLYCEHYSCHADREDVHKLYSLLYVATELRKFATNMEHADHLFKELSIRIRLIIDGIKGRSEKHAEMVENVRHKVMSLGELTTYWERRLQRYEKLGVVV